MPFYIRPYGDRPGYRYADHHDIRDYLNAHLRDSGRPTIKSKLPIDLVANFPVPFKDGRTGIVMIRPGTQSPLGWRGKSSAHRCMISCPDCGVEVPVGRTHQHKCKDRA
jgi:hypothetical protein